MVPRTLLIHLGRQLGRDVPSVTSVCVLYARRATLIEHQGWAADTLGFRASIEHQRRTLTGLIRQVAPVAMDCRATSGNMVGAACCLGTVTGRWILRQGKG